MKAKEYAKQFNDSPTIETLCGICRDFLIETANIAKQRNIKESFSMIAVLDEQNRKWKSFAKMLVFKDIHGEVVKPDGYKLLIQKRSPELYDFWMERNRHRRIFL